jgi:hypothetical protein
MNPREQAAYDALHDVTDDGPECPVNGIPAQFCPRGCTHDEEREPCPSCTDGTCMLCDDEGMVPRTIVDDAEDDGHARSVEEAMGLR